MPEHWESPEWAAVIIASIVSLAGFALGPLNLMLGILAMLMLLDYCAGVIVACNQRRFDPTVGFTGLSRKVGILILVSLAHLMDQLTGTDGMLRSGAILFYAANEGLSIVRNMRLLGVLVPKQLGDALTAVQPPAHTGAGGKPEGTV